MTFQGSQTNELDLAFTAATAEMAQRLIGRLAELESVAVAFSGGVDSAVVAKAGSLALRESAVAVTAVSPSLARSELEIARIVARSIGIRHVEISTHEFEDTDYRANRGDRCFHCKEALYSLTREQLQELGVRNLVNGSNVDDLGDHRPGMQAAKNHQVYSPLIDIGFAKADVRRVARFWNLAVADKPASPCLSSRIAYGVEVTAERVRRVELAEAYLREVVQTVDLRVRLEPNELARIEVSEASIPQLTKPSTRLTVSRELKKLGFRCVTIDLEGFRSGNLNDALPIVQLGEIGR